MSVVAPTTINKAPVVAISAPLNNVSLIAPASLTIAANASDADGTISKVEFYNGSTKLGEDLTSPYNYAWSNIAAGTYSITARAIDNNLLLSSSSIIVVNVTTGTVTSGTAPSVSITSPLTSTSVPAPGRIVINANATDPNGRITKVEFYNGTTRLGQDTKKPYSYTWLNVPAGTYSITAKATDNQFLTTTSTIVVVNVTIPAITSTPTPTPVTSTPVPVTGGTTTNCTVLAIPSATEFSVTNSWSDQNMGSQVLNSADGLQIKHRQSGLDQLWVLRSGKPEVIEKGKTYAISFDFKNDVTNPVTNIALGFAYSLQWDGPVLIQSAVNASADFSSTNYTRKSVNIIATTSGNLNLSLSLKFQHQPTLTAISYLKNLSVCAIASSSLRSADFSSNHEIAPNPFAESTLIRINENETLPMHVVITDVAGRVIETTNEYSTNETMLLGSNLKPGVYYLKASYESNIKVIELLKE